MNFHLGAHYCGGELKSVALYGKAKPCAHAAHDKKDVPPCHSSKSEKDDAKGCCDDDEYLMDALDITTTVDQYWSGFAPVAHGMVPPVVERSAYALGEPHVDPAYLNYKPPLIRRDIPVLIQTFLI